MHDITHKVMSSWKAMVLIVGFVIRHRPLRVDSNVGDAFQFSNQHYSRWYRAVWKIPYMLSALGSPVVVVLADSR